jgi:phospholipase C
VPTIDHVIVLALENRSFDHMLGFLDHPDPAYERLTADGQYTNPGWAAGPPVSATADAKPVLPIGPDHSHAGVMEQLALKGIGKQRAPQNEGFVVSLERAGRGLDPSAYGGVLGPVVNGFKRIFGAKHPGVNGRGPLAMLCQPSTQVPVLSELAREFAVCTRWFCSVPGETWPNRNFLHAATSDGETDIDIRSYDNPTIFELLEQHGKTWHIYYDDTPQVWAFHELWDTPERHANWYPFPDFLAHVAAGQLPSYSFIEPNHRPPLHLIDDDSTSGTAGVSNNQHPENNLVSDAAYNGFSGGPTTDFARAESLIATIYEALRAKQPLFERSLLLVTYDEHGGLYDHVPPPTDVPNPGTRQDLSTRVLHWILHRKATAFDFTMLGPRVPTVVISPYVAAGTIDRVVHDHASVPKTLREIFAPEAAPLTARDEWVAPFHTLLTLATARTSLPDLSAYTAAPPTGAQPTAAAQGQIAGSTASAMAGPVPHAYQAFVSQAEQVHQRLVAVGETEAAPPLSPAAPRERAAEITQLFSDAAERHRQELGR